MKSGSAHTKQPVEVSVRASPLREEVSFFTSRNDHETDQLDVLGGVLTPRYCLYSPIVDSMSALTADALRTQCEHARFLVEEKHAHDLLTVQRNQTRLHTLLRSLPWKQGTARRYDRDAGHGRRETRSARVLTVTGLGLHRCRGPPCRNGLPPSAAPLNSQDPT